MVKGKLQEICTFISGGVTLVELFMLLASKVYSITLWVTDIVSSLYVGLFRSVCVNSCVKITLADHCCCGSVLTGAYNG